MLRDLNLDSRDRRKYKTLDKTSKYFKDKKKRKLKLENNRTTKES